MGLHRWDSLLFTVVVSKISRVQDVSRIVGAREWLDEFWRVNVEGKVALLLGNRVEDICHRDVGVWVVYRLGNGGREESNCFMLRLLLDFGPPLTCKPLPP